MHSLDDVWPGSQCFTSGQIKSHKTTDAYCYARPSLEVWCRVHCGSGCLCSPVPSYASRAVAPARAEHWSTVPRYYQTSRCPRAGQPEYCPASKVNFKMGLQAIQYEPGRLKLLDQRRLPLEETWLTIDSVETAWSAIKDMAVRGAPAIAIAAALALAADLIASGAGRQFASADAAAQHIKKQLDYLVTR